MDRKLSFVFMIVRLVRICGLELHFGGVSRWGYSDNGHGPSDWPNLFPVECAGMNQSPIDIRTAETEYDPTLTRFQFQINPNISGGVFELHNNGHAIQVNSDCLFCIRSGGLPFTYQIEQFHFHWGSGYEQGSEHILDGRALAMELHIVAWNTDRYTSPDEAAKYFDGLTVLAVLYEMSLYDNPELEPIVQALHYIRDPDLNRSVNLNPYDIQQFLPQRPEKYYRYRGSLTTPACYESVAWTVYSETKPISQRQLNVFRQMLTSVHSLENGDNGHERILLVDNYRPVQPLNGRIVYRSFPYVPSQQELHG